MLSEQDNARENPYETPQCHDGHRDGSGRTGWSLISLITLGFAVGHLAATMWLSPSFAKALRTDNVLQGDLIVLTPSEAFVDWLMTLPLGFVIAPTNIWLGGFNSLMVACMLGWIVRGICGMVIPARWIRRATATGQGCD